MPLFRGCCGWGSETGRLVEGRPEYPSLWSSCPVRDSWMALFFVSSWAFLVVLGEHLLPPNNIIFVLSTQFGSSSFGLILSSACTHTYIYGGIHSRSSKWNSFFIFFIRLYICTYISRIHNEIYHPSNLIIRQLSGVPRECDSKSLIYRGRIWDCSGLMPFYMWMRTKTEAPTLPHNLYKQDQTYKYLAGRKIKVVHPHHISTPISFFMQQKTSTGMCNMHAKARDEQEPQRN